MVVRIVLAEATHIAILGIGVVFVALYALTLVVKIIAAFFGPAELDGPNGEIDPQVIAVIMAVLAPQIQGAEVTITPYEEFKG